MITVKLSLGNKLLKTTLYNYLFIFEEELVECMHILATTNKTKATDNDDGSGNPSFLQG